MTIVRYTPEFKKRYRDLPRAIQQKAERHTPPVQWTKAKLYVEVVYPEEDCAR